MGNWVLDIIGWPKFRNIFQTFETIVTKVLVYTQEKNQREYLNKEASAFHETGTF